MTAQEQNAFCIPCSGTQKKARRGSRSERDVHSESSTEGEAAQEGHKAKCHSTATAPAALRALLGAAPLIALCFKPSPGSTEMHNCDILLSPPPPRTNIWIFSQPCISQPHPWLRKEQGTGGKINTKIKLSPSFQGEKGNLISAKLNLGQCHKCVGRQHETSHGRKVLDGMKRQHLLPNNSH